MSQLFECMLQSVAGPYEQYSGTITCRCALDPESEWTEQHQVFIAAVRELQRGAFPDRSPSMWRMTDYKKVER